MRNIPIGCFFIIIFIFCFIAGCTGSSSSDDEIESKSEYSALQFYEYEFRDKNNTQPYILYRNALKLDIDIVGFPIKGKSAGYVWLVVKAKNEESVLILPKSTDFVVSDAALEELKKSVRFSPTVLKFIEIQK